MYNTLIVTSSQNSIDFFSKMLTAADVSSIDICQNGGDARRLLLERPFDIVVINAPLADETGESLARHIAAKGQTQVILAVAGEHFEALSASCEDAGVLTIAHPIDREIFWRTLKLACAAHARFAKLSAQDDKLKQKVADIKLNDRAKWLLMSYLGMTEHEAHRHIEKQAMDKRLTKRAVAEGIINTYEEA
ncbi:MAG: ANTAR domain-containing protein [Defluviitaleaceae bacterium]|nr:ANTAR domain-containing protein [Defluviitaleaceae bacterium]